MCKGLDNLNCIGLGVFFASLAISTIPMSIGGIVLGSHGSTALGVALCALGGLIVLCGLAGSTLAVRATYLEGKITDQIEKIRQQIRHRHEKEL